VVIEGAYAVCLRLARQHYENFPVASNLLPRAWRPHVAAIYAFARTADDFADEGDRPREARLALLDDWQERLREAVSGQSPRDSSDTSAIFIALAETIRRFSLEPQLFEDLLSAFRQDVVVTRYETWDDLLDYCRRSANPVGRLVLRIAGRRDPRVDQHSDAVCTALQLTNFWQDLEIDWRKGRLYVPQTLLREAGADPADLGRRRVTKEWRLALQGVTNRTRALFRQGHPVADAVSGRLRWELRATCLGGLRILDRLEASGFDIFRRRPTLGWRDALPIGWRMLTWRPKKLPP
jgi:squalene synthase HpnC